MSEPLVERDSRITPIRRRVVLELVDYTRIPFSQGDQEWMGEWIEDVLRRRFDVDVDVITVEDVRQ